MSEYFDDDDLINDYMDEDDGPPPPPPPPPPDQTGGGSQPAAAAYDAYDEYDEAFLDMIENEHQQAGRQGARGGKANGGDGSGDVAMAETGETPVGNATNNPAGDVPLPEEGDAAMDGDGDGPPRVIVTNADSTDGQTPFELTSTKERHLYGFERFNGSREWRSAPKSTSMDNTMAAMQWKKHNEAADANDSEEDGEDWRVGKQPTRVAPSKPTTSAPDAQLVRFLNAVSCRTMTDSREQGSSRFRLSAARAAAGGGGAGRMPVEGDGSIAVTVADGSRLYVPKRTGFATLYAAERAAGMKEGALLGVPMSELMRRADAIQRKAERRQRLRRQKKTDSNLVDGEEKKDMDDDDTVSGKSDSDARSNKSSDETPLNDTSTSQNEKRQNDPEQQLWVDKHAPTFFSHLLSDERTNREVLRALREWDPYVFKKAPPPRPAFFAKNFQSQQQQESRSNQSRGDDNGAGGGNDAEQSETRSNDLRPDECSRVLLLAGPPGVGKTTLAHIVARHAGYRPLEVNASDERSASVLTERVVRAMESSTLNVSTGKGGIEDAMVGRPNCLILDEIDGADAKSAITALVEIIRAEVPPKGAKSKTKKPFLRRPIIFICNHKYAPALRPLLPYAREFDVMPPSPNRLAARLRSVLAAENMSCIGGSSMLHQLVAGTGGDIRSCLYALQFASTRARELAVIKRRNEEELGLGGGDTGVVDISQALSASLGGNGRGMKDERSDVLDTISAVFRKLKKRQNNGVGALGGGKDSRQRDVERILQAIECFGDNSKALDCLFMNILRVSYVDPTLDRCLAAHEWLSGADIYRSYKTAVASNNNNEHQAMQKIHIPSAAAAVHLLCRVETRADLTFSTRQMSDARYQLEANDGLVGRFVEGISPKARRSLHGTSVVTDVVPFCLWLLSAGQGSCALNRAVSSMDILNAHEKAAFHHHVATLRALGLTYVKVDGRDNSGNFKLGGMRLEPEIDIVAKFEGLSLPGTHQRKQVPSVLKELLAHGANLEDMRERERETKNGLETIPEKENDKSSISAPKKPSVPSPSLSPSDKRAASASKASEPPCKRSKTKTNAVAKNFLGVGAAKAKAARTARKAAMVGFDRSKKIKLSNSGSGRLLNEVVKFKYQKGFTQAVRVPCRVEDLL